MKKKTNKKKKTIKTKLTCNPLTLWNVSISSKHVLSYFHDGYCVPFPITTTVEGADRPALSEGAVTQQPLRMAPNCGR